MKQETTWKDLKQILAADQGSSRFASEGAGWQWLIDNTELLPEQILEYAQQTGLLPFDVIDMIRIMFDQGKAIKDIKKALQGIGQQKAEDLQTDYQRITAANNLQAFLDGVAENANTPAVSTGFEKLNAALDGGLYEGLHLIGAIPSLGKTTFVMQIADQIAKQGQDVLIISLEMARTELIAKSISRTTRELCGQFGGKENAKTARGITDGARYAKYNQTERGLIMAAAEHYAGYADHIYIVEGAGDISVREIRAAVEQHKTITGRTPVVILDYLQILYPYDVKASDKTNTDKAVLELRQISRDHKTPVIGISSFNRTNYSAKADMTAFKESGGIEYSSDVLISMQLAGVGTDGFDVNEAKGTSPRKIELVILKNRMAKTGTIIKYDYYPEFNWFHEI